MLLSEMKQFQSPLEAKKLTFPCAATNISLFYPSVLSQYNTTDFEY